MNFGKYYYEYEQSTVIVDILSLLLPSAFTLFHCPTIAAKVAPTAKERIDALQELGLSQQERRHRQKSSL